MNSFRVKSPVVIGLIFGAFLLSSGMAIVFLFSSRETPLPVIRQIQNFELLDSRHQSRGLTDLKGKVWVADFMFTTCSGICSTLTTKMAQLHRSYLLNSDVLFVSFTVNPENDTPDVLEAYARKLKIDTTKWFFLTGARAVIHKVAVESFAVGSIEEPVFHSDRFILVDRQGRIRGYYSGLEQESINKLFKDIAKLL